MKTKTILAAFALAISLVACTSSPKDVKASNALPRIYPDYVGVTIPVGIAPLNFNYAGGDFTRMDVVVKGGNGGSAHSNGDIADFNIDDWHHLTERNRGGELTVSVCVEVDGEWTKYRDFKIYVSPYALDEYGITYRRIAPGYEVYGKMGIYQRDLTTFDESTVFVNTALPGGCVNCHTANRTDPKDLTFHVRGSRGATFMRHNGKSTWMSAKYDTIHGSLVYPYWHPSGKYCTYSTNQTHQSFHAVRGERIEVFDQSSDVLLYSTANKGLLLDTLLMTKSHFETYPSFSPDGKTMYFCSAEARDIPTDYKKVRYNLCRISFNPATGKFVGKVDTIVNAAAMGKSVTFPRPSYDGRYVLFSMIDYGCFSIWHKESDLYLLDLRTGKVRDLRGVNSGDTDDFGNWNANSHWLVFASRRDDGLYTRLYFASIDGKGRVGKPFLLPQRNPWEYYDDLLDSYNTPDFTKDKVGYIKR